MKTQVVQLGMLFTIVIVMVSCKKDNQQLVEQRISKTEHYVDSLRMLKAEITAANWESIEASFQKQSSEIDSLASQLPDKEKGGYKDRLNSLVSTYYDVKAEAVKDTVVIEKQEV